MIPRPTVLYVEDEEFDIFFMQRAFEKLGNAATLQAVSDAAHAIAYLTGEGDYADRTRHPLPHVVLLDVNLPIRSGFDLLQWIRQTPAIAHLPVVLFSSSGRPEDRSRAEQLGASDYLLKPSSGQDFQGVAAKLLADWLSA